MLFYQVNKLLCRRYIINKLLRNNHNNVSSTKVLYPLKSRALIKITGKDASNFLQGLITNDMRHFEEGAKSIYAMFLNNKGRVLYDTLIYSWNNEESFMIECDKNISSLLQKHLKIYKLKRKVDIEDVEKDFSLWACTFSPQSDDNVPKLENLSIFKDPRLTDLGFRIITPSSIDIATIAKHFGNDLVTNNESDYKYLRYKLGVSEGSDDLPPGTSFPLEANCDYLHGVSFHKGCYIGQELTARIHHTGVVRKRIMPIRFTAAVADHIERDSVISASKDPKSKLGKLKGVINNYGLGLVRIKEALDAKTLNIGNYSAEPLKPSWWPFEAPKEISKSE